MHGTREAVTHQMVLSPKPCECGGEKLIGGSMAVEPYVVGAGTESRSAEAPEQGGKQEILNARRKHLGN